MWYKDRGQSVPSATTMPVFRPQIARTRSLRNVVAAIAVALGLLLPAFSGAREYEPQLLYLLPVYCRYTQVIRDKMPGGNNSAEIARWTRQMGNTFIHMHHYCFGLMDVNRAALMSRTPQDRRHHLGNSILEFNYVIERAPADFSLLPEILTKKGESLIKLGRGPEAVIDLKRAIRIKADYWQAYAALSDHYRGAGDQAQAREWLRKGLSAAPNAPGLVRRMAELDRQSGAGSAARGPGGK